jgi:hypothetical protein
MTAINPSRASPRIHAHAVAAAWSEEHIGHHFIILWDQQPALVERADLRGKFAPYAKYPGAISLGPAGILPAVRARTRSDVIACTLDPALTAHLEQELDSRPTASLQERPGIEDEGSVTLPNSARSNSAGPLGSRRSDDFVPCMQVTQRLRKSSATRRRPNRSAWRQRR